MLLDDPSLPPLARPAHQPFLARWLDRSRRWHIEYGGFLSNHLAHNLVVLSAAGAGEARMQDWEDLYTGRLAESPARARGELEAARSPAPGVRITAADWLRHLERDRRQFPAFQRYFEQALADRGRRQVLREHLPELLRGLAGAALHPVIHSGWALDADHDGMLADGLAYLATAHQPLATGPEHGPPRPLWSERAPDLLDATFAFLGEAERLDLTGTAKAASETPGYLALQRGAFQPRVIAFDDPDLPLGAALNAAGPLGLPAVGRPLRPAVEQAVALMATALRASGKEFFVLHGLTSLYAVLGLLPHLDPGTQRDAFTHWWRAVMAVLVAQGAPGLAGTVQTLGRWRVEVAAGHGASRAQAPTRSAMWQALRAATLDSRDEHVPKAVYVLGRLAAWGVFSLPTVRLLEQAARSLGRPHPSGDVSGNLWTASPGAVGGLHSA